MFKLFKESDEGRRIIAKYCIMDCILVLKLLEKLQVLNNNIGMANVCYVPLTYIFNLSQNDIIAVNGKYDSQGASSIGLQLKSAYLTIHKIGSI